MQENEKQKIVKKNQAIVEAIKVSQMLETDGGVLTRKYIDDKIQEYRYQDIMGLKDEITRITQQGMVVMLEDLKQHFVQQDLLAKQPMTDEETGQPELLNKKK